MSTSNVLTPDLAQRWDCVIFDFDGVIAQSLQTKEDAYQTLFIHLGQDAVDQILAYHRQYGGLSRFVKFQWFYDNVLKTGISADELSALGQKFSELVESKVVEAPFVSGADDAIHALFAAKVPAFIASGTPQDELRRITAKRNLDDYFKGVFGSPTLKPAIINDIIERYGFQRQKCLFIGDAKSDYIAAQTTHIPFLGIVSDPLQNPFPDDVLVDCDVAWGIARITNTLNPHAGLEGKQ